MMTGLPTLDQLAAYLTERGRLEVDLALARWQIDQQTARIAQLEQAQEPEEAT